LLTAVDLEKFAVIAKHHTIVHGWM